MTRYTIGAGVLLLLTVSGVRFGNVYAHHSFAAEFDREKQVKLAGTVTKVEWQNPHTFFYLDVKDGAGAVTNWALELGSPNGLMREGWSRNTLKAGDVVTVEGSQARSGKPIANARVIILTATGQQLFAASSQTP